MIKKTSIGGSHIIASDKLIYAGKISDASYILKKGAVLDVIYFGNEPLKSSPLVEFDLKEEGCKLNFYAFIIGRDSDKFNFRVRVNNRTGHTFSQVRIRSVLFEKAFVNFSGDLVLDKKADGSETYLAHHTLLLSDGARTHTTPSLEILADDVKAAHAATLGKVNPEDLFYLESRGIDSKMAQQLLIVGFFEDLLIKIEDVDLRDSLRQAIIKALNF